MMHHLSPGQTSPGKVFLVGAGPGDPDLLTLRALRCLMQADVVLHDRLVDARVLHYAPEHARLVDVGKRAGQSQSQAWIERLMIAEARKGLQVVRLKGGDPYVFGRGGEEAEALARAGIAFEVIPGLSSAIAVPALAGIPVLHRHYASLLTIVSGHRSSAEEMALWGQCLAHAGTLVILMGMANLAKIVIGLRQVGVPAQTPVAVIASGSSPHAQTIIGDLNTITQQTSTITAPAVIVIGHVVALHALVPTDMSSPLLCQAQP